MPDTQTSNHDFTLIEVGSSEGTWGGKINANWALLDDILGGSETIAPDLTQGAWEIGGVAVTLTAGQINDSYRRANILGSVALAGSVPTGAVIENGSNANGSYTRFADGTMICRTAATFASSVSGAETWTYPSAFVSAPAVVATARNDSDTVLAEKLQTKSETAATVSVFSTATGLRVNVFVDMIAFGRWA